MKLLLIGRIGWLSLATLFLVAFATIRPTSAAKRNSLKEDLEDNIGGPASAQKKGSLTEDLKDNIGESASAQKKGSLTEDLKDNMGNPPSARSARSERGRGAIIDDLQDDIGESVSAQNKGSLAEDLNEKVGGQAPTQGRGSLTEDLKDNMGGSPSARSARGRGTIIDDLQDNIGDFKENLGDLADIIFGPADQDGNKPKKEKEGRGNNSKNAGSSAAESQNSITDFVVSRLENDPVLGPVFSNLEDFVTGGGSASAEVAEGRRIFRCMTQENHSGSSTTTTAREKTISSFLAGKTAEGIAMGVLYHVFNSPADIEIICPLNNEGTRALTSASANTNDDAGNKSHLRRRKLPQRSRNGNTPNYPYLDPIEVYKLGSFQNRHMLSFLGGDLNDRAAIGALVDELNDQIVVYQTTSTALQFAGQVVFGLGQTVSTLVPAAGIPFANLIFDFGGTVRGLGIFIESISTLCTNNVAARQRALLKISNHKSLIDSAEIEASYKNSQILLGELNSLRAKVAELERTRTSTEAFNPADPTEAFNFVDPPEAFNSADQRNP